MKDTRSLRMIEDLLEIGRDGTDDPDEARRIMIRGLKALRHFISHDDDRLMEMWFNEEVR